jgi:2-amino-4-hydroxy-6-hydroxymethyldihydropteridine diphosphokinase
MPKRKQLNGQLTLISTEHFPYYRRGKVKKKHKALLGIGGNIGDVLRRFEHLFHYLKKSKCVTLVETAPILKNPPFGYLEQAYFYNSLLLIETNLTPRALLRYILRVEKLFGRKRLFKDGPRTLDIDMIFYENIKMMTEELTLPHPEWMKRSSVLIPLSKMKSKF